MHLQEVHRLWSVVTWCFDLMSSGREALLEYTTLTRLLQIKLMTHIIPYVLFRLKRPILHFCKSETAETDFPTSRALLKKKKKKFPKKSACFCIGPPSATRSPSRVLTIAVCFPAHQRLFRKHYAAMHHLLGFQSVNPVGFVLPLLCSCLSYFW